MNARARRRTITTHLSRQASRAAKPDGLLALDSRAAVERILRDAPVAALPGGGGREIQGFRRGRRRPRALPLVAVLQDAAFGAHRICFRWSLFAACACSTAVPDLSSTKQGRTFANPGMGGRIAEALERAGIARAWDLGR
jgi:nucleotidyltransferase/DNA polymerase involved in DNA repair